MVAGLLSTPDNATLLQTNFSDIRKDCCSVAFHVLVVTSKVFLWKRCFKSADNKTKQHIYKAIQRCKQLNQIELNNIYTRFRGHTSTYKNIQFVMHACTYLSQWQCRFKPPLVSSATIIHRESKKWATLTMAITVSILDPFAKSFAAAKTYIFPTKFILVYPPHIVYVVHYLGNLKSFPRTHSSIENWQSYSHG